MEQFALIIFGVTSNLAKLKLIPALYDLEEKGLLSDQSIIVGIARSPLSKEEFQKYILEVLSTENRHHQHDTKPAIVKSLVNRMKYLQGNFEPQNNSDALYRNLKQFLLKQGTSCNNHLYYLATYPELYEKIFSSLQKNGLNKKNQGWVRLMIEKPIGHDLKSARLLNRLLKRYFSEEQIYRLDHYLGKDTIQNILVFSFGNGLLQPLMNREYVDHIQITSSEDFGIGKRGGYYNSVGCLKDVGQNHRAVTDGRIKILKQLEPDPKNIIFGQYNGYRYEDNIKADSQTDTFFALKTQINSERWRGVPIYMRAGKKLAMSVTEISIVFKIPANRMFPHHSLANRPNTLTYRIQPNEGIALEILTKRPGHKLQIDNDLMQFCYSTKKNTQADAYEKLIYDAISGDPTFFNDSPEVEASWAFIDQYLKRNNKLHIYDPGSWGPEAADKLIKADKREWIEPSLALCNFSV